MPIDLTAGAPQGLGRLLRAEGGLPRRAQARSSPTTSRAASWCRSAPTTITTSTRRSPCPDKLRGSRRRDTRRAAADVRRAHLQAVLRRDGPGQEEREGARDVDHAAARDHPLLHPPGAAVTRSCEQAIRDGLRRDGLLHRSGNRDASAASCAATPTSRTSTTSTAPASTSRSSTASRSTTSTTGLKEVWASPFEFRSFSWRQTLIDDPLWVLSSVVILESVPNDKSGVLVTADVNSGEPGKMTGRDLRRRRRRGRRHLGGDAALVAARASSSLTLFKSPWKNQLQPGGGSAIVPATGQRHRARAERAEADRRRRTEDHRRPSRRCWTRPASRGRGTSSSASPTASSGSSSAGRSSATTSSRTFPALAPLEGPAPSADAGRARSRSRRCSNEDRHVGADRRRSSSWRRRSRPPPARRRAGGERHDLGRQRAAAGRLLPLVRAVLLHRLRAAHAGSDRVSTSSSRAAIRCASRSCSATPSSTTTSATSCCAARSIRS